MLRRYTRLEVRDYAALLHLRGQWRVSRLRVEEDDWIASRPLGELRLPEEGVAVLGVEREDGAWLGAPRADVQLAVEDTVVLYGRSEVLEDIAERVKGTEGDVASARSRASHAERPPADPPREARGSRRREPRGRASSVNGD